MSYKQLLDKLQKQSLETKDRTKQRMILGLAKAVKSSMEEEDKANQTFVEVETYLVK